MVKPPLPLGWDIVILYDLLYSLKVNSTLKFLFKNRREKDGSMSQFSDLQLVYAQEAPPAGYSSSIFLMGPSPREMAVQSWRPQAIQLLREAGFRGVVFVPESRGTLQSDLGPDGYLNQLDWEEHCLHLADVILVWLPRDLENLPGFTTNVEWGAWQDSGKIIFGAPTNAPKTPYLRHYADKLKVPTANTLQETVQKAVDLVGEGEWREEGEREVPLLVWRTAHFQQWYGSLRKAGNVLDHARLVWTFRVGPERRFVFFWALHAEVYITAEGRSKTNEVVLSRPDIATIVLYRRAERLDDSTVVLIREFRTPVSNQSGYVWEVPGGSSFKPVADPRVLAAHECQEETGLELASERFNVHGARQLVSTLSAHQAHLFSAELTEGEVQALRAQQGVAFGVLEDTERTFVEITTLGDIRREMLVDWSMLGMIMQVLA